MPVPGTTLTKRLTFIDGAGAPILGATFTVHGLKPDNTSIALSLPVELGNGIYEFSMPTSVSDPVGSYYLQVVAATTPPQVREVEWVVKPLGTPARWRPGDTVMDFITVIGPDAQPVLGDTFTISAYNTVGSPMPVAPPVEVGNGVYRVALTTSRFDPPGIYYISLTSNSFPTQLYEVEFETGQPVNLTGGTTLRDLRRRIMAKFGDIVSCTATQNGSETEFIDEDNLVGEPSRYAGREALVINGANAGQKRYIAGSSRGNMSVTFQRPLPFPTAVGDQIDITNAFGVGVTFQAVEYAIREAIEVARTRSSVPVNYTITDWEGGAIPIPVEAIGVNDVYAIDADGVQRRIRRATNRSNGWMVDKATQTIHINGYEGWQADGRTISVNIRVLPNLLVDDDDVTMIDSEWLVAHACAQLCLDTVLSRASSGDWGSKGMLYKQDAERMVTRLTPNIGVNYQAVR